jgi:hypothetical protein
MVASKNSMEAELQGDSIVLVVLETLFIEAFFETKDLTYDPSRINNAEWLASEDTGLSGRQKLIANAAPANFSSEERY